MPIALEELKIYDPYDVYLSQVAGDRFKSNRLHDKLKGLPEKLFDFLFDISVAEFIKGKVAAPLGLTGNQSKEVAKIVLDLVIAEWYLGDIVNKIKERMGVDQEKAGVIASLIVTNLMASILEDLKRIHIEKFGKKSSGPTANPVRAEINENVIDLRKMI